MVREAFLADHLRRWAPELAAKTARETELPLYEAAGKLLQAVLELEAQKSESP